MSLEKSSVLVGCHSLEDFPVHLNCEQADSLLACWTIGWHPHLVARTGKIPGWHRADEPPANPDRTLLLVPLPSVSKLPTGYLRQAGREGALLISDVTTRKQGLERLAELNLIPGPVAGKNAKAFLALGYCYLQVQLMTRQLRGSSTLDEVEFERQLVRAAEFAVSSAAKESLDQPDPAQNEALVHCFDQLMAERNGYYPVPATLIDLVLTAPSVAGRVLQDQLQQTHPQNLLVTAELVHQIRDSHPETFQALHNAVTERRVGIAGGLDRELPQPMLSVETAVRQFAGAAESMERDLGIVPRVFARRTFGFTADTPALLDQFNFAGALHVNMASGRFPQSSSGNIRWEAPDGSSLSAVAGTPLDAANGGTWLRLSTLIGNSIDSDHLATLLLVHWPGQNHDCLQDLMIAREFGPMFGGFQTLSHYFDSVYDPGYSESYVASDYRGEYLQSDLKNGTVDPVSRIVRYWQRHYRLASLQSLAVILGCTDNAVSVFEDRIATLCNRTDAGVAATDSDDDLERQIEAAESELKHIAFEDSGSTEDSELPVFNTTAFARRIHLATGNTGARRLRSGNVYVADSAAEQTDWIVDFPGCSRSGLANVSDGATVNKEKSMVEGSVIRNEFFQLMIDPQTGGIRSIDKYDSRNNLMGQQIAKRISGVRSGGTRIAPRYTQMVASGVDIHESTKCAAVAVSRGQLVDRGSSGDRNDVVATFRQRVVVTRGRPVVDIEIEIQPDPGTPGNLNRSEYFCNRLAFPESFSILHRSAGSSRVPVVEDRFIAPNFVEFSDGSESLVLLTAGLPWHRRVSTRMLDSILIPPGETCRKFRLGVALQETGKRRLTCLQHSIDFMTPVIVPDEIATGQPDRRLPDRRLPDSGLPDSGLEDKGNWFFHFNCRNIHLTHLQTIVEPDSGESTGVLLRFHETEDRAGELKIKSPRPLAGASLVKCCDEFIRSLNVEGNSVAYSFRGSEFFQIQLNWKR